MIKCTLKEISKYINGKLFGLSNLIIDSISIDSRKSNTKNCLFLAFKGDNFNSHDFINKSIENKFIAIIVEKFFKKIKISQIVVKNTNIALFKIGKLIRKKSNACFIVITGSCGKTSVKELLVNILKKSKYNFSYTLNNNNNNIGVVLTLLNINKRDKFVILEIGMNKLSQIFNSVKLIKPHISLINNIYISHTEKLFSLKNIIKAKGEIFYGLLNNYKCILNYNHNYWNYWKFIFCNINRIPIFFSLNKEKNSNFYATNIKIKKFTSKFTFNNPINNIYIKLNLPGLHNIENAISAATIAIVIGINKNNIKYGLESFNSIKNRLFPIYLNKNKVILDDTYNSNIGSVISSINVLLKMPGYKILIIGDMCELGNLSRRIHIKIFNIIKYFNINKIISIGNFSKLITNKLKKGEHINNKNILINKIIYLIKKYDNISILFKASRMLKLDNIINSIINIYNK